MFKDRVYFIRLKCELIDFFYIIGFILVRILVYVEMRENSRVRYKGFKSSNSIYN